MTVDSIYFMTKKGKFGKTFLTEFIRYFPALLKKFHVSLSKAFGYNSID